MAGLVRKFFRHLDAQLNPVQEVLVAKSLGQVVAGATYQFEQPTDELSDLEQLARIFATQAASTDEHA